VPAIESVEVLDRFHGVPTFGLFSASGERQLFWRVTGYVPRSCSIWLYIPLTADEENRLSHAEPSDLLGGLVFRSSAPATRQSASPRTTGSYSSASGAPGPTGARLHNV
jgi:hypothetical protein